MSTDIGRREAQYPYHISLTWSTSENQDYPNEITKKWHGRSHVLDIDYMSKGACAFVSLEDLLSKDVYIKKLRLMGAHGEALSISMWV